MADTLAGLIIDHAFREPNFTPIGHAMTATEIAEALPRLDALLFSLLGKEIGEELKDWPASTAWPTAQELRHPLTPLSDTVSTTPWAYPPQNSRLLLAIASPKTIFFPASPSDGAQMMVVDVGASAVPTLHGNGRLIEGALSVTESAGVLDGRRWLYRADLGNWIRLNRVTSTAIAMPLPPEFDDLFTTGLAIRLAPRFGVTIDPTIVARNGDMLARVVARYKESQRPKSAADLRALIRTTA